MMNHGKEHWEDLFVQSEMMMKYSGLTVGEGPNYEVVSNLIRMGVVQPPEVVPVVRAYSREGKFSL